MSRRRLVWQTLLWVDGLRVALGEGEVLGRAWVRAYQGMGGDLPRALLWNLRPPGRPRGALRRLSVPQHHFPLPEYRPWFGVVATLYGEGASLAPTLRAWSETLQRDWEREWERYARVTPLVVNLLMLFFFFPAAAFLLFLPLLASF